jgi:hypothetical protein
MANDERIKTATDLRKDLAEQDAKVGPAKNLNNGDDDDPKLADKCGTYTKGLPHDAYGRVDLAAYQRLKTAIKSGKSSDYALIPVGGTRTQNGPQGALQFDLEGLDVTQFGDPQVPAAPKADSDLAALELLEHYWASLLRDVAFTNYSTNQTAIDAAAEISKFKEYQGPRDPKTGAVTTDLLFRGKFNGETDGPHVSQFLLLPAMFGQYPITQQYSTYKAKKDFVVNDFNIWKDVQDGKVPEMADLMVEPNPLYLSNGRGLASWTNVDVLYQGYFTAFLVLNAIMDNLLDPADKRMVLNPGNPYIGSKSENGFGTFGGPDFAGTLAEVATRALAAVWYQKWNVHLRPRPEAIGGLVHLVKTGQGDKTNCKPSKVILDSEGLKRSFSNYGNTTYLLSQAFPEGSPTHPSYPTGHGTVGGACITILKFFFNGDLHLADILKKPMNPKKKYPNTLLVPTPPTGSPLTNSVVPYTDADGDKLTVNGELAKLGHNISFGHGIHAGIHWRSDTETSLLLGETVALNFLQERARTYNEPFTVEITTFSGEKKKISNPGHP